MQGSRHSKSARGAAVRRSAFTAILVTVAGLLVGPLIGEVERRPHQAAIIPIHGMIDDIQARSVERRIEAAKADGVRTIVFELDTPGGLVTSAIDISKQIKRLADSGVRSVAWVHDEAYSGGAMVAVACSEIVMSSASSIGDCAPIALDPVGGLQPLGEAERAKMESPVLEEFRESAARNGYDPLLCRAMVAVGEEVWWVKREGSQERRFVTAQQKETLFAQPDAGWRLVEKYTDTNGVERRVDQPIDHAGSLLTMSQAEAVAFGLAKGVAPDIDRLFQLLDVSGAPLRLETTKWEAFAQWLNAPLVRGILLVIVLVGGYVEFHTPGVILPGITALVALAIFLAAPYAAGLADIWTIALLIIGLGLLLVEIFVLPGFGVAGVSGLILVLVSLVATFVPSEPNAPPFSLPRMEGTWEALKVGVATLSGSLLASLAGILMLLRFLPQTWLGRQVLLANPQAELLAIPDSIPGVALEGDIGIVSASLRPGGQARFGHHIVDVRSQGEYVESGRRVQVILREGMNVVVRPLPEEES